MRTVPCPASWLRSRGRSIRPAAIILPLLAWLGVGVGHAALEWPQFRGPGGLGVAAGPPPPVHFGPGSNLLWKTELPRGNSSPCITGPWIFLTACDGSRIETLGLDRATGTVRWRRAVPAERLEKTHRLGNPATPTPVTDGRRVYVYFGSFGLLAYDLEGRECWRQPMALPVVEFGTSSSPVLAGGRLIQLCDQDTGSFLVALDPDTGETVWRVERPEFRRGFATPFLWRSGGVEELVVPGSIWLKAYDPRDGTERWTVSGTLRVPCSSPVALDGMLFSASWNLGGDPEDRITMPPFEDFARDHDRNGDQQLALAEIPAGPVRERFTQMDLDKDGQVTPAEWRTMADMFARAGNALLALRAGGRGDITTTHRAWKSIKSLPYVSSPLAVDGRVYTVKNGGLMSAYDAASGRPWYLDQRLGVTGDYYASAVVAGDRLYLGAEKGVMLVLRTGDAFAVLARNDLGDPILATPAIVDGTLYVRTARALWAFCAGVSHK